MTTDPDSSRHRMPAPRGPAAFLRLGAALLALLACLGCGRTGESRTVRVACVVPATGGFSGLAKTMEQAARLAVDQVNARGGVTVGSRRLPVKLVLLDSGDTVEGALGAMREAASQSDAAAVIGGFLSHNAIPMARLAEELHLPLISPGSTHPETTRGKSWVWRMPFTDRFEGRVLARYARQDLRASTAAILANASDDYSRDMAESFRQAFTALGGRITWSLYYEAGRRDFAEAMRHIAAAAPDVLFLPAYHNEVPDQARQARAAGVRATLLGVDGWDQIRGPDLEPMQDARYCNVWSPDLDTPQSRAFVERFRQAYGYAPDCVACLTWDAFGLLFAALDRAQSPSPEGIRQALAGIREFQGAAGLYRYGRGGDPEKEAVILRIEGQGRRLDGQLEPEP